MNFKNEIFDLKESSREIVNFQEESGNLKVTFPCGPVNLYFSPLFTQVVFLIGIFVFKFCLFTKFQS